MLAGMNKYKQARLNAGCCINCGKTRQQVNKQLCDPCLVKSRKRTKGGWKRRATRLSAAGLCTRCGNLTEGTKTCRSCLDTSAAEHKKLKHEVLAAYGGKCVCCNEVEFSFLTLDHVNNDGSKQRRELFGGNRTSGSGFYLWAKRNQFPKSLQVLCFNCNCGKNVNNGICPHQQAKVR